MAAKPVDDVKLSIAVEKPPEEGNETLDVFAEGA